jgi:peroxiredoxin
MNGAYQVLLFLNQEDITLYWEDLTKRDDLKTNSKEYEAFLGGMKAFQDSEAKLAGLHYLVPLYAQDSIKQKLFIQELDTVANTFPTYIKSLPENLFVRQYLLTKGLIEQMPNSVKTYTWRAPQHVIEFMAIDFRALTHSGLLKDVISGYTNLVERFPLEEVSEILNAAIDKVITELQNEPTILQELAQYWFTLLEKKSLFKSAEQLALKMLNQDNCLLNERSTNMFEHYRKMAVGKRAKDIQFKGESLKQIDAQYKLVVFGVSWCPTCQTEYEKLKEQYTALNEDHDFEIVYVSIDTDKKAYTEKYNDAPFIMIFDGKGWHTQAAKDYHVFAMPSYFLLDKDLTILEKIKSVEHLEFWLKGKSVKD